YELSKHSPSLVAAWQLVVKHQIPVSTNIDTTEKTEFISQICIHTVSSQCIGTSFHPLEKSSKIL
ncbi:uncharacterized protein V6R79_008030, partial [Siganus canaliculatus]